MLRTSRPLTSIRASCGVSITRSDLYSPASRISLMVLWRCSFTFPYIALILSKACPSPHRIDNLSNRADDQFRLIELDMMSTFIGEDNPAVFRKAGKFAFLFSLFFRELFPLFIGHTGRHTRALSSDHDYQRSVA